MEAGDLVLVGDEGGHDCQTCCLLSYPAQRLVVQSDAILVWSVESGVPDPECTRVFLYLEGDLYSSPYNCSQGQMAS